MASALHTQLLKQAEDLALLDKRRPKQASLRRAASTAYYSLFHFLTKEASSLCFGASPQAQTVREQFCRRFNHSGMRRISDCFRANQLSGHLQSLGLIPPELQQIATGFVQLQKLRHDADYDLSARYVRRDVLLEVGRVRALVAAWGRVKSHPLARFYLTCLLIGDVPEKVIRPR